MTRCAGSHGLLASGLLGLCWAVVGCTPLTITIGDGSKDGLEATQVAGDRGWAVPRIAVVDVSGLIVNKRRAALLSTGEHPVGLLHEQLQAAAKDDSVRAVILRINSRGGTVTATDAMYREVRRFREQSGKPVVALMMDTAASGGFYVACGADYLMAYPTSVTGSVGVIFQTLSVREGLERIGVRPRALVSGQNKSAGSPLSRLSQQQAALLQAMVDDFFRQFQQVVREARPGLKSEQEELVFDGRVLTGRQALELGLIDQLGDVYDAMGEAKRLAGVQRAALIRYHRPSRSPASPYAATPRPVAGAMTSDVEINLAQIRFPAGASIHEGPGFYYIWPMPLPDTWQEN